MMEIQRLRAGRLHIAACGRGRRLIVVLGFDGPFEEWMAQTSLHYDATVAIVSNIDWDNDLSPGPAPGQPPGSPDCGGQAPEFARTLLGHVVPGIRKATGTADDAELTLVGISMSGLFGMWLWAQRPEVANLVSISGSFWYDGFIEWISENRPYADKFYFSLGEKEKESKNPRLAAVDSATKHIYGLMNVIGAEVSFEYNEGNHFGPLIERIEKAITNLLTDYGTDRV